MAGLSGMKAICAYVGRSEASVLKLVREWDFPARKLAGIWESDTELIDQWRREQVRRQENEAGE